MAWNVIAEQWNGVPFSIPFRSGFIFMALIFSALNRLLYGAWDFIRLTGLKRVGRKGKINKTHRKPREPFFRSVLAMTLTVKCVCVYLFGKWYASTGHIHIQKRIFSNTRSGYSWACVAHIRCYPKMKRTNLCIEMIRRYLWANLGLVFTLSIRHTHSQNTLISLYLRFTSLSSSTSSFFMVICYFHSLAMQKPKPNEKKNTKSYHTRPHTHRMRNDEYFSHLPKFNTQYLPANSQYCAFFFCVGRKIDRATENIRGFLSTQSNLTLVFVACLTVFSTPRRA